MGAIASSIEKKDQEKNVTFPSASFPDFVMNSHFSAMAERSFQKQLAQEKEIESLLLAPKASLCVMQRITLFLSLQIRAKERLQEEFWQKL